MPVIHHRDFGILNSNFAAKIHAHFSQGQQNVVTAAKKIASCMRKVVVPFEKRNSCVNLTAR